MSICFDTECVGAFSCSLIAKVVVGVCVIITTISFPIIIVALYNCLKVEQTCQAPVQLWFTEDSAGRHFINELVQGIPVTSQQSSHIAIPASTMATMPQTHASTSHDH